MGYTRMPKQSGPAAARNCGASLSSAPVLMFFDADTEVHSDTVTLLLGRLENDATLDAVIGSYDTAPSAPGLVSRFRNLLHCFVHHQSAGEASTFWSGCGAVRRGCFEALGGFDESYTQPSIEDVEFGCRLHAAGSRIYLDPRAQVRHSKDFSLFTMVRTDLWQRAVPWAQLWRKYPLPKGLNFSYRERLAAVLVALLPALLLLSVLVSAGWSGVFAVAILMLLVLKWPLLHFLYQHGGLQLAVAALPLYILHALTAMTGLLIGTWKAITKN